MDETTVRPYALRAGEGQTYRFGPLGVDFVVKVGEQSQGRRLAVFEYTTQAGQEPPDHTHATEDEIFYVLRGEAAFRCGTERFEVAEDGCVFLPRGIEHGYRITSAGEARLLVITAPAPGNGIRGWDGFVGRFEQAAPLRQVGEGGQEALDVGGVVVVDKARADGAARGQEAEGLHELVGVVVAVPDVDAAGGEG